MGLILTSKKKLCTLLFKTLWITPIMWVAWWITIKNRLISV